jgi:hypothetical protein
MVMENFRIQSRCECQVLLAATLDADRHVVEGHAVRAGVRENAPAHSIGAEGDRFDVGWLCPFCGRNTLRSFHVASLRPTAA